MKLQFKLRAFLLCSSVVFAVSMAQAAPYYWDIDGATAGAGGASPGGTWISSGSTWSTSSNGNVATPAVTTSLLDDLFFSSGVNATDAYTITLNDAQSAKSLTFQDGTATLGGAGGVITLGGSGVVNVPNTITAAALSSAIGANTDTRIAGSAGLTKLGVGTLTLNGNAANTFTGGLNVNGGTLALDFANLATPTDLINNGNALTFGGGNLSIIGNALGTTSQTLGNVTVNSGGGSLLVNPNNGTDTNITLGTLTATASGGSLVVGRATGSGTGTLAITTATDKDATGIYGGRVVFGDGTANTGYDWATTASAGPGPYTLSAYSGYTALDLTTGSDTANSRVTASAAMTGSRTTNSLKFENPAAASTFDIVAGNTLTLTSGGLLVTGANNNTNIANGSITAGDGTAPADLVVHQFNPAQTLGIGITGGNLNNTPEITSSITDNGGQPVTLVKNGPGSMRFLGTNTFTGGIIVNQGGVDFGINALNNNPMTFNANGFFYTNGAHVTSGSITLNNGSQVTICNNNSSFTVNANVTGTGGLSVANGGQGAITLNLNGTGNTFTGPLRYTANNGTQQATITTASLPDTDTFGTGNITFGAGTASSISHNFTLNAGAVAPLTLDNRRFEMAGLNVNQQINNNSAQPLTITADIIVSGSNGKNLQFGGSGNGTFAGVIANHPTPTAPGTIPNALRKSANSTTNNTLTLASVEGIAVGATITGATLTAGTTITAIDPLTRVVTLSTTYTSGNNSNYNVGVIFTIPGVVNSVSVNKAGAGTWIFSGANAYTGTTAIDAGTLIINGNQSAATGPVGVNGTSTLGGAGTIGGSVTVAAGAKIAPGSSVGTLNIGGSLNLSAMAAGAGTLNFELGPVAASDKIAVVGSLTTGGALGLNDFVFTNVGGLQAGTYKLITTGSPTAGTLDAANLTGELGDFDITLQTNGNDIELLVETVLTGDFAVWANSYLPTVIGLPEDDYDGDGVTNDDERIFGLNPTSGTSSNPISVPFDSNAGTFSFTRRDTSLTGLIYQVWTSTNLVDWEVDDGASLSPGALVDNVQTVAVEISEALLDEPRLFLRVGADVAPPLLSEDFEADDGGFTVSTLGGTPWAYGAPNSPSQGGGAVTAGNSGTKCWGTNLTGGYASGTDTKLRSPVIDLTSVTAANLSFAQSIDALAGHTLEVNVIDDTTDTVIANIIPAAGDANTLQSSWENIGPVALPAPVFGQSVRIEWRFIGDGDGTYNGAYIDDVLLVKP